MDLINGLFELTGGILCWLNVWRLYQDKEVKGVYWGVTALMTAWGGWNLLYYPYLHQWYSFLGGLVICSGNLAWVMLYHVYRQHSMERCKSC